MNDALLLVQVPTAVVALALAGHDIKHWLSARGAYLPTRYHLHRLGVTVPLALLACLNLGLNLTS